MSAPASEAGESQGDLNTLAISAAITELSIAISELPTLIFEIQELRHADSPTPADKPPNRVDTALAQLDQQLASFEQDFQSIEAQLQSLSDTAVTHKFGILATAWAEAQEEAERLKEEFKEDKWLVVFRTVGRQADDMMDSLDRILTQCHTFIWDYSQASASMDSREMLSTFTSLHQSLTQKAKYYLPSTERVLKILGKGISERSSINGEVLRKYSDMKTRSRNLNERLQRTEAEMVQIEIMLTPRIPHNRSVSTGALLTPTKSPTNRGPSPFRRFASQFGSQPETPSVPRVPSPYQQDVEQVSNPSPSKDGGSRRQSLYSSARMAARPSLPAQSSRRESFARPASAMSAAKRAQSPGGLAPKPKWTNNTRNLKEDEGLLPVPPPSARRRSSFGLPLSRSGRATPSYSVSGRLTPSLSASTPAYSASRPSTPMLISAHRPRPSSPSQIPAPNDRRTFRSAAPYDPHQSEDGLLSSLMERALSPTPSASALSTASTSQIPRMQGSPGNPKTPPRSKLPVSNDSPSPGQFARYREMVQTPEPTMKAQAARIAGLYRSTPQRKVLAETPNGRSPSRVAGIKTKASSLQLSTSTPNRVPATSDPLMESYGQGQLYQPNPIDPLDVEIADIVASLPLYISLTRVDAPINKAEAAAQSASDKMASYRFGNDSRAIQCKLIERKIGARTVRKVMCKLQGVWQDCEILLLNMCAELA